MSEKEDTDGNPSTEDGVTVVTVAEEQAQAVIDFVASLEREEAEVSGHMISGGAMSSVGAGLSVKGGRSLSGCWQTGGTGFGTDWNCSDTDKN